LKTTRSIEASGTASSTSGSRPSMQEKAGSVFRASDNARSTTVTEAARPTNRRAVVAWNPAPMSSSRVPATGCSARSIRRDDSQMPNRSTDVGAHS